MKPNLGFIGAVQQKVTKEVKLIVTCQEGPAVRCPTAAYAGMVARQPSLFHDACAIKSRCLWLYQCKATQPVQYTRAIMSG